LFGRWLKTLRWAQGKPKVGPCRSASLEGPDRRKLGQDWDGPFEGALRRFPVIDFSAVLFRRSTKGANAAARSKQAVGGHWGATSWAPGGALRKKKKTVPRHKAAPGWEAWSGTPTGFLPGYRLKGLAPPSSRHFMPRQGPWRKVVEAISAPWGHFLSRESAWVGVRRPISWATSE